MSCVFWYRLYNLKNMKNIHGGMLLLVKLQDSPCNFTKSNTPPWVFFRFFKLYKWYQIAQSISCIPFAILHSFSFDPYFVYWNCVIKSTHHQGINQSSFYKQYMLQAIPKFLLVHKFVITPKQLYVCFFFKHSWFIVVIYNNI